MTFTGTVTINGNESKKVHNGLRSFPDARDWTLEQVYLVAKHHNVGTILGEVLHNFPKIDDAGRASVNPILRIELNFIYEE